MTAQLKINLRPLWNPAAEAIASISERKGFGDVVWNFVFEELKGSHTLRPLNDSEWPLIEEEELDDVNETERTWRDPSAHKTRSATNSWLQCRAAQKAIHQVRI